MVILNWIDRKKSSTRPHFFNDFCQKLCFFLTQFSVVILNKLRTSLPDAIWLEEMVDIPQEATLLYLAHRGEKLIDMALVECYGALLVLRKIKDNFSIIKLPGLSILK